MALDDAAAIAVFGVVPGIADAPAPGRLDPGVGPVASAATVIGTAMAVIGASIRGADPGGGTGPVAAPGARSPFGWDSCGPLVAGPTLTVLLPGAVAGAGLSSIPAARGLWALNRPMRGAGG